MAWTPFVSINGKKERERDREIEQKINNFVACFCWRSLCSVFCSHYLNEKFDVFLYWMHVRQIQPNTTKTAKNIGKTLLIGIRKCIVFFYFYAAYFTYSTLSLHRRLNFKTFFSNIAIELSFSCVLSTKSSENSKHRFCVRSPPFSFIYSHLIQCVPS